MIGRDGELAILRTALERAATSHGGLVLISGEAGIGKSTLVAEAVRGARIASGACWEGAPAYWPWIQVLRALGADDGVVRSAGSAFELYDTVTGLLVGASPLVVVLEDLHWADPASLKLLEFVVQHTWFERLLVLATLRPGEVELSPALALKATTITPGSLSRREVAELIAATTRHEPDEALVEQIAERAGGNPFFVEQLARLWQGGATLPAAVSAVVDSRLSRLPAQVLDTLRTAAVLGRRFRADVLGAAMGRQVGGDLDQAVVAALIVPDEGGFLFVHDLIRETLYASLTDRAARHGAALRALAGAPPAERAEHAFLAGSAEAPGLLMAAARDAGSRLAPEEAALHYARALELAREPRERAEIGLELGTALHWAGDVAGARKAMDDALGLARELDQPALLALAALKCHDVNYAEPGQWADFVRRAHGELVRNPGTGPASDQSGPASDQSGPASEHSSSASDLTSPGSGLDTAARDLSLLVAEQATGDDHLVYALLSRLGAIWGPGTLDERGELLDRLAGIARRTGDEQLATDVASWRFTALLERGDPRYAEAHRTVLARAELPLQQHEALIERRLVAALTGRFDEAQELALAAYELGEQPAISRDDLRWTQLWSVELLRGRHEEADALLAEMEAGGSLHTGLFRAVTAVQRGEAARARALLAEVMTSDEQYLRWMSPLWLRFQAQAAALTGDPSLIANARAALEPYRGQWALTATISVDGPFVHWIAVLDAALERWDEAAEGFTEAWRAADRLGALPWSIEARARLTEVMRARGEDPAGLAAEVERDALAIGMAVRLPRPGDQVFRLDGEVWTLSFAGRTVRLPDSKGLRDLHLLLSSPGAEISAVRMLDPAGGEAVVAARSMGGDEVLDDAARASYRRRLEQLDDEIDRAAVRDDHERVARLDHERQALLEELRRAAGLGGRARRLGDEAERARKAVTNRIRYTLRHLDERHPELAAHLRAALSTGATCRYQPPAQTAWRL
ncbi:ATP-binding protein [Nonomuraea sp. NPDC050663]|uniref:ATP-binding protein n=1 Tax=Nonomuraea sp. NPDC050663 TaxID=3364370 RepID=UPI003799EE66